MNDNINRLVADLQQLLDRDKMNLNKTDPEVNRLLSEIIKEKTPKVEIKPINDYLAEQKTERELRAALLDKAFKVIKMEVDKVEYEFVRKIKRMWPLKPKVIRQRASVEKCCGAIMVKFGDGNKKFDSYSSIEAYHAKEVAEWISDLAHDIDYQIQSEESGSCSCN